MMARGRYGIFLLAILSSTLWAQPLCECFQISQVTTAKCATRMLLPKLTSTHVDGLRANRNRHFTCSVNNHDQQLLPTGRWHVYRSRSSITTSRASAREGNEVSGEREEDENQPESSPDAISADELDSSREKKMEMRDFRQKLLAKGLDGWGVENNGDTDEKGEQATGDDERQGFRTASVWLFVTLYDVCNVSFVCVYMNCLLALQLRDVQKILDMFLTRETDLGWGAHIH